MSFVLRAQLDSAGLVAPPATRKAVVKGVRISCGGAKQILKEKAYIPVEEFKDGHSMLKNPDTGHPVSAVSQLVGMPVYVGRWGPDPAYLSSSDGDIHLNPEALFLMRRLDPAEEGFGYE